MEEGRPQCHCRKSHCLRRYCECFGRMWYCSENCSCCDCRNTEDNEDEVEEQAEIILRVKSDAFESKIARDATDVRNFHASDEQRRHVKGCTCQKSKCCKMYCECFKNNVGCTSLCQCQECANRFGKKAGGSNAELEQPASKSNGAMAPIGTMLSPTEADPMENFAQLDEDPHLIGSDTRAFLCDDWFTNPMLEDTDYLVADIQEQTQQAYTPEGEFPDQNAKLVPDNPPDREISNGHVADVSVPRPAYETSDANPKRLRKT